MLLVNGGGVTGQSSDDSDTHEPDSSNGWIKSYEAGYEIDGKYAGGSEILHIVSHKGKLYAGAGYWMDSRNILYGGSSPDTGWGQILRLDAPGESTRKSLSVI